MLFSSFALFSVAAVAFFTSLISFLIFDLVAVRSFDRMNTVPGAPEVPVYILAPFG